MGQPASVSPSPKRSSRPRQDARPAPAPGTPAAVAARVRRVFCTTVLLSEALVVLFALLVAKDLSDLATWFLLAVGGGFGLVALLLAGLLRYRWAYVAGSAVQIVLIASGAVVPVMYLLGAVFAALWITSLVLARRVEAVQSGFADR